MSQGHPPELDSRPQSRREWSGYLGSMVLPLAFLAVLVGGLLYLQSSRGGTVSDGDFGTVTLPEEKNATDQAPSAAEGRAAPDFLLPGLDDEAVRLSDLQGGPVLVSFWAGWCTSCRSSLVRLADAQEDGAGGNATVLAVNLSESEEQVAAFTTDFDLPFVALLDRSGEVARTWRIAGPDGGLPMTYFIDASGIVRSVVAGELTPSALEEGLSLIAGGGQ